MLAEDYHRSKNYNDGLNGKCKECCASAVSQRKASLESIRRRSHESTMSMDPVATPEVFVKVGTSPCAIPGSTTSIQGARC